MLIDNKKTREISWNDFELEGNKENLIDVGWESFEPYGFGEFIGKAPEEVFDENYAQNELLNGDFRNGLQYWVLNTLNAEVTNGTVHLFNQSRNTARAYQTFDKSLFDEGDIMYACADALIEKGIDDVRFVVFLDKGVDLYIEGNGEWSHYSIYTEYTENDINQIQLGRSYNESRWKNVQLINLTKLFGKGNEPTKEWCDENLKYYPNWQDLSEEEKPVNAYEKGYTYIQPLDNGFTRIRTKGGDTDMKYKSPNFGQLGETGTDMTISLYVENNSDSMIRFSNNLAIGGVPYPDGAEYMITVPREYKGFAYLKGEQVGRDVELDIRSDGNIDMIVSQPEIIEGHDLNAMLLIEDLDDGRKHVQVHNVNENTKLVYTGGGVIKGEPYTLETEIENDGRIFNLSANMLDDKIEVQKGMNDIKKSGELQDKELKIEIGVD